MRGCFGCARGREVRQSAARCEADGWIITVPHISVYDMYRYHRHLKLKHGICTS
jgi:hypothetical protein